MQSDDSMADHFVVCRLDSLQQFHSNPFLLALHQSCHDFGDTISIQGSNLNTFNVILIVILSCLLLFGLLGDDCVPIIDVIFKAKCFNGRSTEFGTFLSLGLAPNEASAIGLATVTGLRICSIPVDIVVEHQLFTSFDRSFSKYAHAQLLSNNPFVDIAVGVARVIAESTEIALLGGVDKFSLAQGHEIKVLDAFLVVHVHSAAKGLLGDDLANILKDEISRLEVGVGPQAVAFLVGLDDRHIGIEVSSKALVLTFCSAGTVVLAFHLRGTIDTIRVLAARIVLSSRRVWRVVSQA